MWSCLRGSDLSRKALEGEHPLGATRTDKGPRGPPVTPRPPHPARPSRIAAAFTPVTARRYSTVPRPHTHSFRSPRLSPPSHTDEVTYHRERGKSAPSRGLLPRLDHRAPPCGAAERGSSRHNGQRAPPSRGGCGSGEAERACLCSAAALRCALRRFLSWSHRDSQRYVRNRPLALQLS